MYRILLAVDADERRAKHQAEVVGDMPGVDEAEVVIYHCFSDNPSGASATQVASVHRAEEYLKERGVQTDITESSGDTATEIVEMAEEVDANIICVGGRKRSPTGKALFGSVAQSVILSTDLPVVVTGSGRQ
ncbi:universal stress protein [Halobacteriaceae archaeon GCM10025711]